MNEVNKEEVEDNENNDENEYDQSDDDVDEGLQKRAEEVESEESEESMFESEESNEIVTDLEESYDDESEFEEVDENESELEEMDNDEIDLEDTSIQGEPVELSKEEFEAQLKMFNRNLIEASLYASGKPLDVEELSTKLEIPKKEAEELIQELALDYLDRPTALIINQVGEKYQMALRTEYVERVAKFSGGGGIAERYLRTLTVIALKQPILKSLVIKLRGTGAYEHIKYLVDNDLVSAVKKGRSDELSTTDKYSEMFGLPKNKEELKKVMIEQLGLGSEPNRNEP
jgi:segregation and condensation protein B